AVPASYARSSHNSFCFPDYRRFDRTAVKRDIVVTFACSAPRYLGGTWFSDEVFRRLRLCQLWRGAGVSSETGVSSSVRPGFYQVCPTHPDLQQSLHHNGDFNIDRVVLCCLEERRTFPHPAESRRLATCAT